MTLFAFYGTFTSNQPGHGNLAGAQLVESTHTAPRYRLYVVDRMWPAVIPAEDGLPIACELYDADEPLLARLAELEPPGWNRSELELDDGRVVEAFLGERTLAARGEDISSYGSWAAYRDSLG
jgi:gamma-glutamylcyclotransferase (GGCT)/AIG2-like uncharacterized protein YtfP